MIIKENYLEPHIRDIQALSKGDPGLIERTLFAFGLLEALRRVGMNFIFKGGTSLLLLLPSPKRLSTDIDIVVEPGTDVDKYINEAAQIFPFVTMKEQYREGKNRIVKRHFKFTYDSPIKQAPLYILLDILFEENHYECLVEKSISNELLLTEGENMTVVLPSVDCVLGDKMTAFAPYTTGIPLRKNKDLEVIKQFYDVSTLIDAFEIFEDVRKTYYKVSWAELRYRISQASPEDALADTIQAAICIGSRGKVAADDFPSYIKGSREIVNHIYERGFSMEVAAQLAPKVIYMAVCLLMNRPFERIKDVNILKSESLSQKDLQTMKAFRKMDTDAYGYLVLADKLLKEYRS